MRAVERAADARREAPAVLKFIGDEVGRGEGVEQEVREQEAHEMLPAPRVLTEIFGELAADDLGPEGAQPHQAARVEALHTIGDLIFVQLLRRALGERAVVAAIALELHDERQARALVKGKDLTQLWDRFRRTGKMERGKILRRAVLKHAGHAGHAL